MTDKDIIKSCKILLPGNQGISLEEEIMLKNVAKLKLTKKQKSKFTSAEIVSMAIKRIHAILGRSNITPRDLKKAVVTYIEL